MKLLQSLPLFCLAILLSGGAASGQSSLMGNYDFSRGGYYIIGEYDNPSPHPLADSLKHFYCDNPATLSALQSEWTFFDSGIDPDFCGHHYTLKVCSAGVALRTVTLNLNCSQIGSNGKFYEFDPYSFTQHKTRYATVKRHYQKFTNVDTARTTYHAVVTQKNVVLAEAGLWLKYDGAFDFIYPTPASQGDAYSRRKTLLKQITNDIKAAYPGEPFKLSCTGGSGSNLQVQAVCNQSLFEKFKLYGGPDLKEGFGPIRMELVYWTR